MSTGTVSIFHDGVLKNYFTPEQTVTDRQEYDLNTAPVLETSKRIPDQDPLMINQDSDSIPTTNDDDISQQSRYNTEQDGSDSTTDNNNKDDQTNSNENLLGLGIVDDAEQSTHNMIFDMKHTTINERPKQALAFALAEQHEPCTDDWVACRVMNEIMDWKSYAKFRCNTTEPIRKPKMTTQMYNDWVDTTYEQDCSDVDVKRIIPFGVARTNTPLYARLPMTGYVEERVYINQPKIMRSIPSTDFLEDKYVNIQICITGFVHL